MTDDELRRRYSRSGLAINKVYRPPAMSLEDLNGTQWFARFLNWIVPKIGAWLKKRDGERS